MGRARIEFPVGSKEDFEDLKAVSELPDEIWEYIEEPSASVPNQKVVKKE